MTWTRTSAVAVLALLLLIGGWTARADDDPKERDLLEARASFAARAMEALKIRLEARLGQAETLRALGRLEEALQTYRSVDQIYEEGLARIEGVLDRVGQRGADGPIALAEPRPVPKPKDEFQDEPFAGPRRDAAIGLGPGGSGRAFRGRGGKGALLGGMDAQTCVMDALKWLKAHQSPDGGWEAAGFGRWCDGKPAQEGPDGPGKAVYDVGTTGLALCAFLGAGYTNRGRHPFAKSVSKGLRYLKNVQDAEGCFGPRTTQHYIYNHAVATLAMVEAYGMTQSPIFQGSAQKALDFIASSRNPYFAWRYGVKPGDNDTSVTGWMVMALKSAKVINEAALGRREEPPLRIDHAAFDGARAWIDKMTDPDYGRVGYIQRGGSPARPQELIDRFPGDKSEAMTAVGVLVRVLLGEDPRRSAIIRKGADLMVKLPPVWNPADGSIDMYYWYYGTLAMYQVGGEVWTSWNRHLKSAIIPTQRRDTTYCMYKGSWDPIGPWCSDGGRVYSTALLCMCLEVYYRYERVFGTN